MIPFTTAIDIENLENLENGAAQPSYTYKLDIAGEAVSGYTDNLEAVKQAVFKILRTERYESLIYSGNYGAELADLFGQPLSYVQPELERRISEALSCDERVVSVGDFRFSSDRKSLTAAFTVKTVFGEFSAERSVEI